MEEWTRQLAALTDDARQETARALLAELTGETSSVTVPGWAGTAEPSATLPDRMTRETEPDSAVPDREAAQASEPEKSSPAGAEEAPDASGTETAVLAETPEVLVTKHPDGTVTLRRREFPARDRSPDGETELSLPTRQETAIPAYDRMREVSDFFRRDTRRYDPGYTRY